MAEHGGGSGDLAAVNRRAAVSRPALAATQVPGRLMLVAAIGWIAFNLRPALAAVGPVLVDVQRSTGLSSAAAGLLTTIPVLAFGLCAPVAPALGRRFGIEATLVGVLVLLVAGIAVRSVPALLPLFAGTVLLGTGIAVGNVLVPALIKRDFQGRTRVVTGVYSVALSGGAAVAAGVTVPLDHAVGASWRGALGLWAVPAAVCLLVWTARMRDAHHDIGPVHVSARLWRDPVAWQVTIFMGLQSLGFYALLSWIPAIFVQHGVHATAAGWLLSLSGFASLPTAFAAPVLASTPRRQRWAIVVLVALDLAGLLGMLWRPVAGAPVWMVLIGVAQGGAISLALSFIVLRAPSSERAAELSAMAQSVGYLLAALGPVAMGLLRDATGNWQVPLAVMAAVLLPELVSGLGAARPATVGGP